MLGLRETPKTDRRNRRGTTVLAGGLLFSTLAGCVVPADTDTRTTETGASPTQTTEAAHWNDPAYAETIPTSTIVAKLGELAIKGRAPKTGYSREQFGSGWSETNSCDTRNRILKRDLIAIKYDSNGCTILSGTLPDPYTGKDIPFIRGRTTSDDVQIDHVVPLSNAWQTGAQQLDVQKRIALANNPLNLSATEGKINQQKSDGDAATWLPPNKAYRCSYVARQVLVKEEYDLWVTQAEHDAIRGILSGCDSVSIPR